MGHLEVLSQAKIFAGLDQVDKMVLDGIPLLRSWFGGADVQMSVDRHGIQREDFRGDPSGQFNADGRFSTSSRTSEEPTVLNRSKGGHNSTLPSVVLARVVLARVVLARVVLARVVLARGTPLRVRLSIWPSGRHTNGKSTVHMFILDDSPVGQLANGHLDSITELEVTQHSWLLI